MEDTTQKSFDEAKDLLQKFQLDAVKLPLEISTILISSVAIAWQRISTLAAQTVIPVPAPPKENLE